MRVPLIPERISARAATCPDAAAIVDQRRTLTYGHLLGLADQVAGCLLAHGVSRGDVVGVCLDRGSLLPAALLGVLRAGCGYLPLEPGYPPDRLRFMLRDSGAATVVGTPEHLAWVPAGPVTKVDMAEAETAATPRPERPGIGPRDLAYVIYTSGSTGTPKGVAVEHGQVARLFDAVQQRIPVTEGDIWSWSHSVAFDFSIWEIWGSLTSGGRLVVVSEAEARDPDGFLAVLRRTGTTILSQTPSAFQSMLTALGRDGPSWSVRAVLLGGEAISTGSLAEVLEGPPGHWPRLYNLYGITEATVHSTVKELTRDDLAVGVRSPIGTPLGDVRLAVLDQARRPVPAGEQGELWVGGAGVARGYVGRPALNADRFVTGLLPEDAETRWYRSGDLGRQLPSGEFEYIGRIDRQVKLRGFRVELGEIEAALAAHRAVSAAVVESRGTRLDAYLTLAEQDGLSLEDIREWLAARLPGYMMPSSFHCLGALPLTPNGKVDRNALSGLAGRPLPRRPGVRQPETGAEATLYSIWAAVLDTGAIGTDDNFFAIGGDSMLALRVVAACKRVGLALTVRDIYAHPTLAALGDLAAGRPGQPAEARLAASSPAPAAGMLIPASQMQRGMLFEAARNPEACFFHVVSAVRVTSPRRLSEQAVRTAVRRLATDNASLRTSFDLLHHGRPMQVVHEIPELCLAYLDLSGLATAEQQRRIREVFDQEERRRFTEVEYPLWRVTCVQLSPRAAQILLAHHHAILDGWSVAGFFDQFTAALGGQPHRPAPAGLLETTARLEDEALMSAGDNDFWQTQARQWKPLPFTRRAADGGGNAVVTASARMDPAARAAVRAAAARWQCSPKHVYLAAHLRVMAELAHWDGYAATGLLVNVRPELPDAHRALGMFLNLVPLAVADFGATWADLARAAMAAETALLPHRWFPQATIVTRFGISPPNVCFNYTDFSATAMHSFLRRVREQSPNSTPLTVSVTDDGLIIDALAQYFSAQECTRLVEWHLDNVRAAVAESLRADPEARALPASVPQVVPGHVPGARA